MMSEQVLNVRRLRTGSLFHLVLIGMFFSIMPYALIAGIFSLFGLSRFAWDGHLVVGLNGLFVHLLAGMCLVTMATVFIGTAMAFGLFFYSNLRPLRLAYLIKATDTTRSKLGNEE